MTKLTLTYVASKPQVSKSGKPYTSQSLKATEHGERYLSGFGSKETMNWKVGDVVEVDVTESDKLDKNGKPYLNWKLPNKEDAINDRFAKIEFSIANLHRKIDEIVEHIKMKEDTTKGFTSAGTPVPTFIPNTDEQAEDFMKKMDGYDPLADANAELDAIADEEIQ